jgi:hypothetical protein
MRFPASPSAEGAAEWNEARTWLLVIGVGVGVGFF